MMSIDVEEIAEKLLQLSLPTSKLRKLSNISPQTPATNTVKRLQPKKLHPPTWMVKQQSRRYRQTLIKERHRLQSLQCRNDTNLRLHRRNLDSTEIVRLMMDSNDYHRYNHVFTRASQNICVLEDLTTYFDKKPVNPTDMQMILCSGVCMITS